MPRAGRGPKNLEDGVSFDDDHDLDALNDPDVTTLGQPEMIGGVAKGRIFDEVAERPGRPISPPMWIDSSSWPTATNFRVYEMVQGNPHSLGLVAITCSEEDFIEEMFEAMPKTGERAKSFVLRPVDSRGNMLGKEVVKTISPNHTHLRNLRDRREGGEDWDYPNNPFGQPGGVNVYAHGQAPDAAIDVVSQVYERSMSMQDNIRMNAERQLEEERRANREAREAAIKERMMAGQHQVQAVQDLTNKMIEGEKNRSAELLSAQQGNAQTVMTMMTQMFAQLQASQQAAAENERRMAEERRREEADRRRAEQLEAERRWQREKEEAERKRIEEREEAERKRLDDEAKHKRELERLRIEAEERKERERLEKQAEERRLQLEVEAKEKRQQEWLTMQMAALNGQNQTAMEHQKTLVQMAEQQRQADLARVEAAAKAERERLEAKERAEERRREERERERQRQFEREKEERIAERERQREHDLRMFQLQQQMAQTRDGGLTDLLGMDAPSILQKMFSKDDDDDSLSWKDVLAGGGAVAGELLKVLAARGGQPPKKPKADKPAKPKEKEVALFRQPDGTVRAIPLDQLRDLQAQRAAVPTPVPVQVTEEQVRAEEAKLMAEVAKQAATNSVPVATPSPELQEEAFDDEETIEEDPLDETLAMLREGAEVDTKARAKARGLTMPQIKTARKGIRGLAKKLDKLDESEWEETVSNVVMGNLTIATYLTAVTVYAALAEAHVTVELAHRVVERLRAMLDTETMQQLAPHGLPFDEADYAEFQARWAEEGE
jgi:hypothetical protein